MCTVTCVRTLPSDAERMKNTLLRLMLLDRRRAVQHSNSYVYFPILSISNAKLKRVIERAGGRIVQRATPVLPDKLAHTDLLARVMTRAELALIPRGFDLLGSIAIVEIPRELEPRSSDIAEAVMEANPRIKTVLAKAGAVSGVYRTRKLEFVAGKRDYIAVHRENGCTFRFDVRKAFFSARLAHERSVIVSQVRPRERVMVMFAGVGPFAIEIAKAHPDAKVVAIELNPDAHSYMLDNIELNRVGNVKAVLGDVKTAAKDFSGFADRIVMPMPKTSAEFLDEALLVASRTAVVHMYAFSSADKPFEALHDSIIRHSSRRGYSVRFLPGRIVRPYSASEVEVVVEYVISKRGIHAGVAGQKRHATAGS